MPGLRMGGRTDAARAIECKVEAINVLSRSREIASVFLRYLNNASARGHLGIGRPPYTLRVATPHTLREREV